MPVPPVLLEPAPRPVARIRPLVAGPSWTQLFAGSLATGVSLELFLVLLAVGMTRFRGLRVPVRTIAWELLPATVVIGGGVLVTLWLLRVAARAPIMRVLREGSVVEATITPVTARVLATGRPADEVWIELGFQDGTGGRYTAQSRIGSSALSARREAALVVVPATAPREAVLLVAGRAWPVWELRKA